MKQQNALPKPALDQLAREQRVMADMHPDADVLTAFCEGALTGAERSQVMEHIARCGDCREVVFLAAPDALSQPAAVEEKAVSSASKPALSWWRRYMPAVAAAAAVVVVGSAVLLQPNLMRSKQQALPAQSASIPSGDVNQKEAASVPERQQIAQDEAADKVTLPNKASEELSTSKKAESLPVGGAISGVVADARKRDEATGNTQVQQQQLMASGPHGPMESKGYSGNYQNMAVTPPQATRVAPGAHGDLEAKGNAYFMSNAAPQVSKEQLRAGTGSAPAAKDQQADATSWRSTAPPMAAPAKAKTENQMSVASAKSSATTGNDKNELVAADVYRAGASDGIIVGSQEPMPSVQASVSQPYRFRIDDDGELQRSAGRDEWKPALAKAQTRVNAVSVLGMNVWAGGSQGRLFHSKDGGDHWTKIQLEAAGKPLGETITSIRFRDQRAGTITTDSGAVWETYDGGAHWRKKR